MNKLGFIIIIAGPSGAGKSTVREELIKNKSLNLVYSISSTTRKKRRNETNGVDYNFITEKEFRSQIRKGEFLEHAKYCENYYGTNKNFVDKLRNQGKNVVLEIEINGVNQVIKKFKKSEIITFFITPPSIEELERRIRGRLTETEATLRKRLKTAKEELKMTDKFDYVIVNDKPERAAKEISTIIKNAIALRG